MTSITVEFKGGKELLKALEMLGSEVAGQRGGLVRTALFSAALPVLRSAQNLVHVGTYPDDSSRKGGALKAAITRSRQANPDPALKANEVIDVGLFKRGKGKRVFYGAFEEFGTSRRAAHPFLTPALETNRTKSLVILRKKLGAGIVKAAKKVGNANAAAIGAKFK